MTREEAIKASIKHWETMRDYPHTEEVPDEEDCALCVEYRNRCRDCPLGEELGGCYGDNDTNPYNDASEAHWDRLDTPSAWRMWQARAQEMIDTLRSLLD